MYLRGVGKEHGSQRCSKEHVSILENRCPTHSEFNQTSDITKQHTSNQRGKKSLYVLPKSEPSLYDAFVLDSRDAGQTGLQTAAI
jgi:hypothetical protein